MATQRRTRAARAIPSLTLSLLNQRLEELGRDIDHLRDVLSAGGRLTVTASDPPTRDEVQAVIDKINAIIERV